MNLPNAPLPSEGFYVTHFLTVLDQSKSSEYYAGIVVGKIVNAESPCIIKLSNSWIILNNGGGPTPDKPEVFLESPQNPNKINSFIKPMVSDIHTSYRKWKE